VKNGEKTLTYISAGVSILKLAFSKSNIKMLGNRLLGSCAVYFCLEPTFRRNVSPPSSVQLNRDENIEQVSANVRESGALNLYSQLAGKGGRVGNGRGGWI
jgi:uncharacterized membrane protein